MRVRATESEMISRRLVTLLVILSCLSMPFAADAQQVQRVYRVGVLETISPALNAPTSMPSDTVYVPSDTLRGRTSSSNIDRPTVTPVGSRRWQPSWFVCRLTCLSHEGPRLPWPPRMPPDPFP